MTIKESRKNGRSTFFLRHIGAFKSIAFYIIALVAFVAVKPDALGNDFYEFPYTGTIVDEGSVAYPFLEASSFLEEECGDGIDNDGDGKTDCEDEDCGPQIASVNSTLPSACLATDGTISISVTGGLPPYRYSIDNGQTWQTNSGNYTNLENDTYNIRVANADESCIALYAALDLYNPDSPILDSVIAHNPTLCFLNDGTIDIYARGSGLEYSVDGGNNFTSDPSFSNLSPGVYRVRVKKNDCIISYQNIFIMEPDCASDITIPTGDPSERCLWNLNEVISLDLEGNLDPTVDHTYIVASRQGLILDVASTPNFGGINNADVYIAYILGVENGTTVHNMEEGNYLQEISIESLCYEWSEGFLFEVCPATETDCSDGFDNDGDGMTDCEDDDCSPVFMSMSDTNPTDCGVSDGTITVNVSGGQTGNYVFSVDNGQSWQVSSTFTNLDGGLYQVLAANQDESCPRVSPDIILENPLPPSILNVLTGSSTSCEMSNGSITILASGSGAIQYSINGGSSYQDENQFTGLSGGTYQIRIRNIDGSCIVSEDDVILNDPVEPIINSVNANDPSSCGQSDGTITINATGNNIEYSINGGNTYSVSNVFSGLGEGTFNVAVRNNNGSCRVLSDQNPITLTSGAVVDITNVTVQQPSSCDATLGEISIFASGVDVLQYSINGGSSFQASSVFSNLTEGTYAIVVSNSDGSCPETYPNINLIDETPGTIQNADSTNPTDCGLSNGSVIVNATEGSASLEYKLNDGNWQNSNQFNNLTAGSYLTSIRNVGGACEVNGPSVTVIDPVAPSFTDVVFTDDVRCDSDNGSITISATGSGALEYSIDGGASWSSSNQFTGLSSGNYQTSIRNADGSCQINDDLINISENINTVTVSLQKTDPLCNSELNGSLSTSIQGGVHPFTYAWSNNSSEDALSGIGAGNYSVTVTDSNGCMSEASETLSEPSELTSSALSQDDETCNNCLVISASGGTTPYEYSANGIDFQNENIISDLRGGFYTVTVRDANNCISTSEVELIDFNPLACSIEITNEISCNGFSDASVTVNIEDGEAPFEFSLDSENWTSNNVYTGLMAGDYTIYVRDNAGNNSDCQVLVSEPDVLVINASNVEDESCPNAGDGSLMAVASGGTEPLSYSIDGVNYQSNPGFANMAPGVYNLAVRDDKGCEASVQVTVDSAQPISCDNAEIENVTCNGLFDGSISVNGTGGKGSLSYTLGQETNQSGVFSNLGSGNYDILILDINGCTKECSFIISESNPLSCTLINQENISCNGEQDGQFEISVSGGTSPFNYVINGTGTDNELQQNLAPGIYIVVVEDANGCTSQCEITISEPDLLELTAVTPEKESCHNFRDGNITIEARGGSGVLEYSIDGINFQETSFFEDLEAGDYEVAVRDQNDCTVTNTVKIEAAPDLFCDIVVNDPVSCFGNNDGRVVAEAGGGVGDITFSLNGIMNQTGEFTGLSAGSYIIQISDDNGCVSTCAAIVSEGAQLSCDVIEKEDVSCYGAADGFVQVSVLGGTLPITYQLGNAINSDGIFNGISGGTYTITATDVTGCLSSCEVTIEESLPLACEVISKNDISCFDEGNGGFTIGVNGGTGEYTYRLNGAVVNSPILTGLNAGNYVFSIEDENGCTTKCEVSLGEPNQLTCTSTVMSHVQCAGGTDGAVRINALGGQGIRIFSVNDQTNTTGIFDNLTAGFYSASVRDENGCVSFCDFEIIESADLGCSVVDFNGVSCAGADDGMISVGVQGGRAPITYSIDGVNYSTSNTFNNLSAGFYLINVRDANGCNTDCSFTIQEPSQLLCIINEFVDVNCSDEANGRIVVAGSGGTAPYEFSLNNAAFTSSGVFEGLAAGSYNVRVMDSHGCISLCDLEVSEPSDLECIVGNITNTACSAIPSGSVTVFGNGGQPPYQYSIDGINFQNENTFTQLATDVYTISIKDASNCVVTCQEVTIEAEGGMTCSVSDVTNVTCSDPDAGQIVISTQGGVAPVEYSIDGSSYQLSNVFVNLSEGYYTVFSRDANGCETTCTTEITMTDNIAPTVNCPESIMELGCNPSIIPDGALLIAMDAVTATDEDGTASVLIVDESLRSEGCQFTSTIRFKAVDDCGAETNDDSYCTIEVIWTESNEISINCPDDLILSCGDLDNPANINNWLTTVTVDNTCGGEVTISHSFQENNFEQTCSNGVGTQVVTFTVEDDCGNSTTCTAQIEIIDNVVPLLSGNPGDLTIGEDEEVPIPETLTATDECSTAEVTYSQDTVLQNCGYTLVRTWGATDECGNIAEHTQRVNVSESLVALIQLDNDISCFGELGAASVIISKGNEPYVYTWSNGESTSSVQNLTGGSHTVTVTDGFGCSVVLGVNISEITELVVDINLDQAIACDIDQLGAISLNISGGKSAYEIEWEDGSTDIQRSGLSEGIYTVMVTDDNGCETTNEIELEETANCTAEIHGSIWEDLARDGIRGEDDQPIVGILIELYKSDETLVDTMRSNVNGSYGFADLPVGNYFLKAVVPTGFGITSDAPDGDNNFNNSTKLTDILSLGEGEIIESIDLGVYRLGKISGIVWSDSNQNGIREDGEVGIFNARITLLDEDKEVLASTFTAEDGSYSFINLPPATYYVEFEGIESLSSSPIGMGDDPALSSYADPESGLTAAIVVSSGDCYEDVNAGFYGLYDLELVIYPSKEDPQENELIAFTIELINNGDIDANEVDLEVELLSGMRNPISISNNGVLEGNKITWTGLSVQSGKTAYLAYRAEVAAYDIDFSYQTIAQIIGADGEDVDSSPGNFDEGLNEDDESSVITAPAPSAQADLSLSMSVNNENPTSESVIGYTLILTNNGPDVATGIEIINYLPAGSLENFQGISGSGILAENRITWFVSELANGESVEFSFEGTVLAGLGRDDIMNSAEVVAVDQFDPNSTPGNMGIVPTENDEAISIASVNKMADLELDIVDHDSLRKLGERIEIVLELENKGFDDAAMVRVTNYVPSGFMNVADISDGGIINGNEITWTVYDVDMNDQFAFSFTAELIPVISECDPYLNKAEVLQSSSQDPDSSPGNQAVSSTEDDDDYIVIGIKPEQCIDVNTRVLLEGAYKKNDGKMQNTMYLNGYLPGQMPQTFFGHREEPGQPYYNLPWEHCGEEGDSFDATREGVDDLAGYPDNTVDWVLVSLRTSVDPNSVVCRKGALVLDDGEVLFVEGFDCCDIDETIEYYLVIEHRNHLPVMSPRKIPLVNGTLNYDFTTENSYMALFGSGQKEVTSGLFAMIAGNGQQMDYIETGDINVNDLSKWSEEEGDNSGYYFSDFDLNGDVNVQDKGVVLRNFGMFTDVDTND